MARPRRLSPRAVAATAGTLVSLGLLVYLFARQGSGDIVDALRRIPPLTLLASCVLFGLSRIGLAARWYFALRSVDMHIPFMRVMGINFASLYACNFLPSQMGGDIVRLGALLRTKQDAGTVTASLVVDHTTGLLSMLLVVPPALPAIREFSRNSPFAATDSLPGVCLLGAAGGGWLQTLRGVLKNTGAALRVALRRPGEVLASFLASVVFMAGLFGAIHVLLLGLGESVSFWTVAGLWAFVYVASGLPISLNGIGLQELSISYAYTTLGGASEPSALIVAVLVRVLTALWSLPGAPILPGIMAGSGGEPVEAETGAQ